MSNPSVSIVMPVFNGQDFIKKAIDSVLNQTFEDFEFIIINDGSTDDSEQIILSYNDHRIKYIYQDNTGIGGALSKGCALAEGKYIARMDADDICLSNRLELQFNFLEDNNDYVLVSSAVFYIDTADSILGRSFPYTNHDVILKKFKYGSTICHPSVMMRRDAYCSSGGYSNLTISEDLYLWLKLIRFGKLYNFSSPLLQYRVLESSLSRSISTNNFKDLVHKIFELSCNSEFEVNAIKEINSLHQEYKEKYLKEITLNVSSSVFIPNTFIERKLIEILDFLKFSDSQKQSLICSLKNLYGRIL